MAIDLRNYDSPEYQELKQIIEEKKQLRDPLIEVLHKAQGIFGFLPSEVQEYVSEHLGVPVNKIYGVVTFYNFFSMKPRGKYVINVCTGTACFVKGAPKLMQNFEELLGIKKGETTPDGMFTLSEVRCVGACSLAPVFVVGEETYGRVTTKDQLKRIVDTIKANAE
ncbi:MAG: NAD(P)H-dependent oxidoreductase subunit E [Candidatus Zophobacter franzmannii]|jgi:NADH:ubiquinone oxidoreductase subunit E|nr:NAD(P)H-dependent oxidoreductase subunit E [Candidatus Zophobacter franzmannii]